MGNKLNTFFNFARRHKYWITTLVFAIIIGFADTNSLWHRYQHKREISTLRSDIRKYHNLFDANKARLNELATSPEAIEKIARERYFMKTENEDVFIFEGKDGKVESVTEVAVDK